MNTQALGDCFMTLSIISLACFFVARNADALAFREVSEPVEKVGKFDAPIVVDRQVKTRKKRVTSIDQLPKIQAVYIRPVDGDTGHFGIDGKSKSTRLTGIDTAELHFFGQAQNGGLEARDYLNSLLIEGKTYTLKINGNAAHDRLSAFIFDGDKSINEEMVKSGWAWPCPDYLKKFPELADKWNKLFEQAKKERRGVWSLEKNPRAPWLWRDEQDRLHKRGKYKK